MTEELNNLVDEIIIERNSMVPKIHFESIYYEREKVNALEGDIVECGVYKGGMSLFLTKLFPDRRMWAVDSYIKGFADINEMKYKTDKIDDPHKKGYPICDGNIGIDVSEVKELFKRYGEGNNNNVNYLEGYVGDVLKPEVCPIDKIALLRIDVDSYSGTREVLEYLYPKVVLGGMIIFDDGGIGSAIIGITEFFENNNIILNTHVSGDPDPIRSGLNGQACYMFKE